MHVCMVNQWCMSMYIIDSWLSLACIHLCMIADKLTVSRANKWVLKVIFTPNSDGLIISARRKTVPGRISLLCWSKCLYFFSYLFGSTRGSTTSNPLDPALSSLSNVTSTVLHISILGPLSDRQNVLSLSTQWCISNFKWTELKSWKSKSSNSWKSHQNKPHVSYIHPMHYKLHILIHY